MANQEHLAIFQQGVETWNHWRKEHRDISPDLSGIDITNADLNDVRLSFAQLQGACFRGAQLQRAYFVSSDLSDADFRNADLREAHLDRARLKRADLSGARLQQAKTRSANLQGANLSGADLSFTHLEQTSFGNAHLHETDFHGATIRFAEFFNGDFSTAKRLETVIHTGPSHLGVQTLSHSLEHLPAPFLQGVGVPDAMLTYARSQRQKPIVYPTCFLSYASADQHFAEHLHSDLQSHGVFCWSAPYDDGYEEKYTRLDVPIFLSDILLLVITEHSRTEASHRALNSIMKEALVKERRGFTTFLLPIHLDKDPQQTRGVWPRVLRLAPSQGRDFSHWKNQHLYQEALQHLLRDLRVS